MDADPLLLLHWLGRSALPLWREAGWDREERMFVEALDRDGAPLLDRPRRLMVQARQIYTFELADRRGWAKDAAPLALEAAGAMVDRFYRVDGRPGWSFSVDRSGRTIDARRDLYAHAFVLLALASLYRTSRNRGWLDLAQETLTFLDSHMAGASGGYVESWPQSASPRRQNPHMHLLESLLALHEASGEAAFLERATTLVDLCIDRFVQPGGVLAEHFDDALSPLGVPDIPFEPGHHFEWVWLFARYRQLAGDLRGGHEKNALWTTAMRHGVADDGRICALARRGAPVTNATRLWAYAEAAKAAHAMDPESGLAQRFLAQIFERFVAPAKPGVWIEAYEAGGAHSFDHAPASSLYHMCCALDVVSPADASGSSSTAQEESRL